MQTHINSSAKSKKRKQKNGHSFVTSLQDLKDLLSDGYYEFKIILGGGGVFSRKYIYYDPKAKKPFSITNCIDDSEQELTEKQLMDDKYTHIGTAIQLNALVVDLTERNK